MFMCWREWTFKELMKELEFQSWRDQCSLEKGNESERMDSIWLCEDSVSKYEAKIYNILVEIVPRVELVL